MRFKIIGADKTTGEDRHIVVDALDAATASATANRHGVLVATCTAMADSISPGLKHCPYCGETIKAEAIKCRFCGEMLQRTGSVAPPPAPTEPPPLPACAGTKSRVWSKLLRGGILGLADERFCVPESQMKLTVNGPATPAAIGKRIGTLIGIAFGGFVGIMLLASVLAAILPSSCSDSQKSGSGETQGPGLPTISVTGGAAPAVTITDWRVKGYNLYGTLVWDGSQRVSAITYTLRRNGLVKGRGDVSVPGGAFQKGEPVEICVMLWEEPKGMDVTIEVMP